MSRRPFWTAYRRHYVHELLERGVSRALISARLGVKQQALTDAIRRYRLNVRDPANG